MRKLLSSMLLALLAACAAPTPTLQFVASKKPATELRAAETRLVPDDVDDTMRAVIETLQDLGYRITRVESDAHTISATRETELRMGVAVQPRSTQETVVRANATIAMIGRETQVDSPEFYQKDFFAPLAATMALTLSSVPDDVVAPEPVHPAAELNTVAERKAAQKHPETATQAATGTKPP